jgi:WD40 repeat protein/DNA-directed RNA polymerase specialized sigma24 family protein
MNSDRNLKPSFPLSEPESDPERDLAYWLEAADPSDPQVLRALYGRYASGLQILAAWELAEGERVDLAEVRRVVRSTFEQALSRLSSFRGQASVGAWIAGLALREVRRAQRRRFWRRLRWLGSSEIVQAQPSQDSAQTERWRRLSQLPEKQRLSLILRYAWELKPDQTAGVLGKSEQKVNELLNLARRQLLDRAASSSLPAHPDLLAVALAALDAPATDSITEEALQVHLNVCPECRVQVLLLRDLHASLTSDLGARWTLPEVSSSVISEQPGFQTHIRRISNPLLWEVLSVAGVLLLVLAFGWGMSNQDTHRGRPLFRPTPGPTPTAQVLEAGRIIEDPLSVLTPTEELSVVNFTWLPSLSSDGHWMVFSRLVQQLVAGAPQQRSDIMLMDMQTRQVSRIGSQDDSGFDWYTFDPAFSADGNFIAFDSNRPDLSPEPPRQCTGQVTTALTNCSDIFINTRQTGEIRLVSRALDGGRGNGDSSLPAISANGRFVAFWSAARNLVEGRSSTCALAEPSQDCWNVYVRDMVTGEMVLVPVGRLMVGPNTPELDSLSISQDGRWLGLSIQQSDEIAPELNQFFSSEAYLYDLEQGTFLSLNFNSSGQHGNGASKHAVLTPDGRYVAFVSQADNLVSFDQNEVADVFVLDRQANQIELVSVGNDGRQSEGPSGSFMETLGSFGERISFSADGRYVAFLSTGGNLSDEPGVICNDSGWFPCTLLVIRDRQEGSTRVLVPPMNVVYLFPSLSADGQMLTLVHYDLECPRVPYCSVILTYNMQTHELVQSATGDLISVEDNAGGWQDTRILESAGRRANCLAFQPGSTVLASGMDDGQVMLWQADTGMPFLRIEGRKLMASAVAFSPDGSLLAAGWRDGHVSFYHMPDGEQVADLTSPASAVLSLEFSSDGEMLAVGGTDYAWSYEVRQRTFAILDYLEYPGLQVTRVAFSPDGRWLVHGLSDGSIWIRRSADGELIARLMSSASKPVTSLAFSPDSAYLADGSVDGRVNLWRLLPEPRSLQVERVLSLDHLTWIGDVLFSPSGSQLFVATLETGMRVWQVPGGELLPGPFGSRWDAAVALAFSSDGHFLALDSAWGGIKIWQYVEPFK